MKNLQFIHINVNINGINVKILVNGYKISNLIQKDSSKACLNQGICFFKHPRLKSIISCSGKMWNWLIYSSSDILSTESDKSSNDGNGNNNNEYELMLYNFAQTKLSKKSFADVKNYLSSRKLKTIKLTTLDIVHKSIRISIDGVNNINKYVYIK